MTSRKSVLAARKFLALVGLATVAVGVVGWKSAWRRTVAAQQSFDVRTGGTLTVKVADADIELVGYVTRPGDTKPKLEVEAEIGGEDLEYARQVFKTLRFSATQNKDGVVVRAERPRVDWNRHQGFGLTIRVKVPSNYNLDLRTDDGDITVQRLSGSIDALTEDGDIRVIDGQGESVLLRTQDGDVTMRGTRSSVLDIETSDGDIVLNRAAATQTRLRTSDGDITMRVTKGAPATLRLEGDEVRLPKKIGRFIGRKGEGMAMGTLNGGGPSIDATTDDGTITMGLAP